MKKILFYIALFFLGISTALGQMQQLGAFTFTSSSLSHQMIIPESISLTVNQQPIAEGDVIGVFYDSAGVLACAGAVEWANQTVNLVAYGNDGLVRGFEENELFSFRVWDRDADCILEDVLFNFSNGQNVTSTNRFTDGGVSQLSVLIARIISVEFSQNSYCFEEGSAIPELSVETNAIRFVPLQSGLVIDEATGEVFVEDSQTGVYTIFLDSEICLERDTLTLEVRGFDLGNTDLEVTNESCLNSGSIFIDEVTIEGGAPPFQYSLRNIMENRVNVFPNGRINDLSQGTYELRIIDANGCGAFWATLLTINQDPDCPVPVFTPNGDGIGDTYFIPYQGTAKVYDRLGVLQKELPIPSSWDGTNSNGQLVPMGVYVILCDGGEELNVTLVK